MTLLRNCFFILMFFLVSCAGQMPTAKSAHSITAHYFESYGKKYKTSFFGQGKVTKVEINQMQAQARNLTLVDAFVTLQVDSVAHVLLTMKKTPPLGWGVQSWEMLESR